ncbi:unnamed protein product [Thelazia callipaeda]|uniref:EB domain-containing protein n=1 Tax=Thelazia callipaeda TaxID=103827 RepID=A0A0N5D3S0_THECL|nr:unnamed protein product [Thelazia callipaeda]
MPQVIPCKRKLLLITLSLNKLKTFKLRHTKDECYDALKIRSGPERCVQSSQCYDSDAECVYSIRQLHHICCRPNPSAIFPKCPSGRQMLIIGKSTPLVCTPSNSIEDDICPLGYECLPSVTNFTKGQEQSNNVCCKAMKTLV